MTLRERHSCFFRDFAVTVTVDSVEVQGIFDRAHIETLGAYGGGVDSSLPILLVRSIDVTTNNIRQGSTVALPNYGEHNFASPSWWGGTSFTVRSVRPDGTGLTVLELEKAL